MKNFTSFVLALLLILSFTSSLASDPAVPANEELVKELLPDYTLVEGNIHRNEMRLLMNKPDGTLVFVGAVQDDTGAWHLDESSPLPEGTTLGVENFVHSLGIPTATYYDCVSVQPYADYTWGISMIYPDNDGLFRLGKNWICYEVNIFNGTFGRHPWSDLSTVDWTSLPDSYADALAALDTSDFAVVANPDPADRLHLRTKPDRKSDSLGKFYNGTPVLIRKYGKDWCAVTVAGMDGWMMSKYLVRGDDMDLVEYAGPWLTPKQENVQLFSAPNEAAFARVMEPGEFYVLGLAGEKWYIIWLPHSDEYAFVRQDDLWPGNG